MIFENNKKDTNDLKRYDDSIPFGQIQFAHPKRLELFNISLLAA
jgi:hypothetical protein